MFSSFTPTNLPSTRFCQDEAEWPRGSHLKSLYGQNILFHSVESNGGRFLDEHVLESVYRERGDAPLDTLLEMLHHEGRPIGDAEDLMALAAAASASLQSCNSNSDQALASFYKQYSVLPCWVNVEAVARGQQVFLAYAPAIGASLFYRSLVPGFSVPKIAAVLLSTGYLAPPATAAQVQKRLTDTGAFVAAVVAHDVSSILPGSQGWKLAFQVRVLHAKVRRALLRRRSTTTTTRQWKIAEYGVPINQEDLAATLLAFSYNSMLGCEMILGRPWCVQERLDFLHFWRYIGWLLGIECSENDTLANTTTPAMNSNGDTPTPTSSMPPLDPCGPGWLPDAPDPLAHSHAIFGSILLHLSKINGTSVEIAHHLLRLGYVPPGKNAATKEYKVSEAESKSKEAWFYFRAYQCRRFSGDQLADALLLPYHPVWYKRIQLRIISNFYLCILRLYSWAALPGSPFRKRIVNFHRRNFAEMLSRWQEPSVLRSGSDKTTGSSSCPFAMVAPPQY